MWRGCPNFKKWIRRRGEQRGQSNNGFFIEKPILIKHNMVRKKNMSRRGIQTPITMII